MNPMFKVLLRRHRGLTMLALLLLIAGALAGPATPTTIAAPIAAPSEAPAAQAARCFPETGQCMSGRIRSFWEQNGGLPVFGFPVEPQQGSSQRFQRHVLELHPENQPPYDVLLSRLGAEKLGTPHPAVLEITDDQDPFCDFFPATGHNVCAPFNQFWGSYGLNMGHAGVSYAESLALFGLPLTEAIEEDGRTTQYFERGVMRIFPENQPPYDVQLDLLGVN